MMNWPSQADWDWNSSKNLIHTYLKLTKIFSSLKLRWTIPWLWINSIAAASSFAQYSTLFLANVFPDDPGMFSGFWKIWFIKFSLHNSKTCITRNWSPSFSNAVPKNLTIKGKPSFLQKIVASTFIQVRLGFKVPEYFSVFQLLCYHTDLSKSSKSL